MSNKQEPTLADVMAAIQGLQVSISGQDGKLTSLLERLDDLSGRMNDLTRRMDDLTRRMDRLEAATIRQDEKLTELRVVAMERIDRLQNAMDQMRDEVYCWLAGDKPKTGRAQHE